MTWLEKARVRRGEIDSIISDRDRLSALNAKLQAFINTPDWGAIDSGASIKVGDIVRFGALRYRARVDHTKALTKSPINLLYWEVVTDG